jgi:hypothetical protein
VAEAIPELLRLCDLEVRIPRMEVVALEKLAARDGKSVDAVLAAELRDLVSGAVGVAGLGHPRVCVGACLAVLTAPSARSRLSVVGLLRFAGGLVAS